MHSTATDDTTTGSGEPHRDQASTLRRLMRGDALSDAPTDVHRNAGFGISVGPRLGHVEHPADGRGDVFHERGGQQERRVRRARIELARAVAITSGKGGVGKTNLAVNLAIALSDGSVGRPQRVCLLDADLGMANADVLCGLSPRSTLEDVLLNGKPLEEVVVLGPGGFRLVPGASGVAKVANLGVEGRRRLLAQLASLERCADLILIDTAAGIASNSVAFSAAAHTVLVAVTPEPTSITDAYGAIKTIVSKVRQPSIRLVVNMVSDRDEGEEVFRRIDRVSRTFLETPLELAGIVPFDPAVRAAVKRREPFVLAAPDCPASLAVRAIARGLASSLGRDARDAERAAVDATLAPPGRSVAPDVVDPRAFANARASFLGRLTAWLARR